MLTMWHEQLLQCALKHLRSPFLRKIIIKVCLSVPGTDKTGNRSRYISFCFLMMSTCAKGTALMNMPENYFRFWGYRKFNFRPNHTCQTRV